MGTQSLHKSQLSNSSQLNQNISEHDMCIYKWRSQVSINQFISRTYIEQKNKFTPKQTIQRLFHLKVNIKFQKYIGNLHIFKGRLTFQQCIYVVQTLLKGYQVLYQYFGRLNVSLNQCFITQDGQVKAWINQDYRSNHIGSKKVLQQHNQSKQSNNQKSLFLDKSKWLQGTNLTTSEANIIQSILFIVKQLVLPTQNLFDTFLKDINKFILENMQNLIQNRLLNYNFTEINRYINNYAYEKKIFIKSNLRQIIQLLYFEYIYTKRQKQNTKQDNYQNNRIIVNSRISIKQSPYKSCINPICLATKQNRQNKFDTRNQDRQINKITKNNMFDINNQKNSRSIEQAKNLVTNCDSFKPFTKRFNSPTTYYSHCQNSSKKVQKCFQPKSSKNNSFSPRISINVVNLKSPVKLQSRFKKNQSKIFSYNSNISTQFSSKTYENPNNAVYRMNEITESSKQGSFDALYRYENKMNTKSSNFFNETLQFSRRISPYLRSPDRQKRGQHVRIISKDLVCQAPISSPRNQHSALKKSSSICINSDLPFSKLFKPNCQPSCQNRDKQKQSICLTQKQQNKKKQQKSENYLQFGTAKTITRLLSSDRSISNLQISQGESSLFQAKSNQSSYDGVLASMGRIVTLTEQPPKIRQTKTSQIIMQNQSLCSYNNSRNSRNSIKSNQNQPVIVNFKSCDTKFIIR